MKLLKKSAKERSKERSLDVKKDPYRPKEEGEEVLGSEVPYLSAISALLYLAQCTRPDISFSVNLLSRYNSSPTKRHWAGIKHVLIYLRGTTNMGLFDSHNSENSELVGYADSGYLSNPKKIIFGLAKGLEYLHVECNPNIIHFDIKPQNILLDGDFNVKISDFGLAKLIDRDKSQVITALKGTPGYVAPELFSGINISVKADIFSFGIVLLEIILGRKNLDLDKSSLLINLVKEKVKDDQVSLLVDEYVQGTESEKEEVIRMIKIGIWCLQTHNRRPSMSTILKVLQGLVELESTVEFENLLMSLSEVHIVDMFAPTLNSLPPDASILSGPR